MARTCVFCGSDGPLTKEHVWPDWHRRSVGARRPVQVLHRQEEAGKNQRRIERYMPPFTQTVKVVCSGCNNGWMAQLEVDATKLLSGMLAGRGRELHAGGRRTLSLWALKTAMMLDMAMPATHRVVFPEHFREVGESRSIPKGTQVAIAGYDEALHAFAETNSFEVSVARRPEPSTRNVYVVTFTIGSVAFRVIGTIEPKLFDYFWAQPKSAQRIHPSNGAVTWTANRPLDWTGLAQLQNAPRVFAELEAARIRV